MNSFSELIRALGGAAAVAPRMKVKKGTAQQMKARNIVRPEHWPVLIEMSVELGIKGITHEKLTELWLVAVRKPTQRNQARASGAAAV